LDAPFGVVYTFLHIGEHAPIHLIFGWFAWLSVKPWWRASDGSADVRDDAA
jgi:hypothetical protein